MSWEIFYKISAVASVVGLVASGWAALKASGAEKAAQKASKVITLQKINNEVSDIIHACDLKEDVKVNDVHRMYGYIGSRLTSIIEVLTDLVDTNVLTIIQNDMSAICNELDKPVNPDDMNIPNNDFNRFTGLFRQLKDNLGRLKGKIDKKLLEDNK